uniref:helix-turn-helix domain-containing protein n=1 Tax=Alistipes sp. TaxID=1872444 RepID=UPI004056888C
MTGEKIREKIREKKITLTAVATRMGMSLQALYARLGVDNISTDTLERVAEAIDEPVSYFYNEFPILSLEEYTKIAQLRAENEYLKLLLNEKERMIDHLSKYQANNPDKSVSQCFIKH